MSKIIPLEVITNKIFEIRGQKVMIDVDLAILYDVQTKRLNEAVKRNKKRFPDDFMFKLNKKEKDELVANCDRFTKLKHSTVMPHGFTEGGVAMLSSVLNSDTAIQMNIQIIRAFIHLKQMLVDHKALHYAIEGLEKRMSKNERYVQIAINAIHDLLKPPTPKPLKKKNIKIGFGPSDKKNK